MTGGRRVDRVRRGAPPVALAVLCLNVASLRGAPASAPDLLDEITAADRRADAAVAADAAPAKPNRPHKNENFLFMLHLIILNLLNV